MKKNSSMIKLVSNKIERNRIEMFNIYSKVVHHAMNNSLVPFYWDYDRIFSGCATVEEWERWKALDRGNKKLLRKLREWVGP